MRPWQKTKEEVPKGFSRYTTLIFLNKNANRTTKRACDIVQADTHFNV